MPGFDINRIVGLDTKYGKTLECAICLLILDNPIITDCGHNYCYECLQYFVQNGSDGCPKCRKRFAMKLSNKSSNDDNCVIIQRNRQIYVFVRNLTLSEIISKLKINCDFEFNGCQKSLELGLLSAHLKDCEHRLCKKCNFEFTSGKVDEHNCLELLKSAIADWKRRFGESEGKLKGLKIENSKLRTDIHKSVLDCNELKDKCFKYEQMIDDINRKRAIDRQKGKEVNGLKRTIRRTIARLTARDAPVMTTSDAKDLKSETNSITSEDQKKVEIANDKEKRHGNDEYDRNSLDPTPVYVNLPDDCDQSSNDVPIVTIDLSVSVLIEE